MSNATYEKMRSLHLKAMAEAYREQIHDAKMNDLSFENRMAMLVDREWDNRHSSKITRLVKGAAFEQPFAHIAELDFTPDRRINRDEILNLATCSYLRNGHNVVLMGATGSGKTYMACALGMEACKQGYSVRFVRMTPLLEDMHMDTTTMRQKKVMKDLQKCNLLIIDDWLLMKINEIDAGYLFELLHSREMMPGLATILCTQYDLDGCQQRIQNPTIADALTDRLKNSSYIVNLSLNMDFPSMREKYGIRR